MLFHSKNKLKDAKPEEKKDFGEVGQTEVAEDEIVEVPKKKEKTKIRIAVAKRK